MLCYFLNQLISYPWIIKQHIQRIRNILLKILKSGIKNIKHQYQQIQYIYRMITILSLQDAVSKVYGKSLVNSSSPATQWQLFSPFSTHSTNSKVLIKLLEVPSYLYTSEQICNKKISRFKNVLHEVKLIFVERCFQSSYYLLIAEENLIPISSLLKIKKESGEKIDETVIFDFLQFSNKLQNHPYAHQISFTEDQIGINSEGNFVIANYLMYFQNFQKTEKKIKSEQPRNHEGLIRDIKTLLCKMFMPEKQNVDFMSLNEKIMEKYGKNMLNLVEKCMQSSFDSSQVLTMITSLKTSKSDESYATMTDSFVQDIQKLEQHLTNQSMHTHTGIDFSFNAPKAPKSGNRKKTILLILTFLVLLVLLALITIKFLRPHPLMCQQSQYPDPTSMTCLNCDSSCQKCSGAGNLMCTSCKGNLFLILTKETDKTGRCGEDCHGTVIKTKTCIDRH